LPEPLSTVPSTLGGPFHPWHSLAHTLAHFLMKKQWTGPPRTEGSAKDGGVRQGRKGTPRTKGNAKDERERQGRNGRTLADPSILCIPFNPWWSLPSLALTCSHFGTLFYMKKQWTGPPRTVGSAKDGGVRQGRRGPPRTEGSAKDGGVRQGQNDRTLHLWHTLPSLAYPSPIGGPFHPWHSLAHTLAHFL
jgi:hypothetical protein